MKISAKNRKYGRNKLKCAAYSATRRRDKNKKALAKHLRHQPNDRQAFHAHQQIH